MKAKGVQRIDGGKTHGYQARVWDGQRMHTKMFSDGVWGGQQEAFYAALKHRNEVMQALGLPVTNRVNTNPTRRSKSGATGVYRAVKVTRRNSHAWRHIVYRVVWFPEQCRRRVKDFYVREGDEREAFARAAAFRQAREAEMLNQCGGDVARQVQDLTPAHLPPDVREEVSQEISLALLEGSVTLDALDACAVRGFVRKVNRGYSNRFSYISLDHLISDGLRLEETLEG